MSSLAEMRAELRELRKSHPEHKPVSKMRKADISSMIQKLKVGREETASVATASPSAPKMFKSATESIKTAKASEFPLAHHSEMPSKPAPKAKAKKEMPVAKADKKVMVTERGDVAAKKPRGKKAE
jgi:hypothetical protein